MKTSVPGDGLGLDAAPAGGSDPRKQRRRLLG